MLIRSGPKIDPCGTPDPCGTKWSPLPNVQCKSDAQFTEIRDIHEH